MRHPVNRGVCAALIAILMASLPLLFSSCKPRNESVARASRIDSRYAEVLRDHGVIVVTDASNNPIDFFRFPSDRKNELFEIEIFTNPEHKELGFHLVGDLINTELDTRFRYVKKFEAYDNHYRHNGAKFEVRNRKVASFMGTGFSENPVTDRQLSYVYSHFADSNYQHTVEIIVSYLIEEHTYEGSPAQIIASYNLANGDFKLRRDIDLDTELASEELNWRQAEHRWLDWRDQFLENRPF